MIRAQLIALCGFLLTAFACSSGSSSGDDNGSGPSCTSSSDCHGSACIAAASASAGECLATCTGSANSCGAQAQCGAVGASINVCQSTSAPKQVQRVACTTDDECSAVSPGAVCATWNGLNGCTALCTDDSTCQLSADGVTLAFFSCQKDQGPHDRDVCLPKESCVTNPTSCVSGTIGLPDGTAPEFDGGIAIPSFDASLPGFER